jgi:hypothetical protein
MCQGSKFLHMGDSHWENAIFGDPDDFWDRAVLAQNDYRRALGYAREKDIELEGTILTRLARFYAQVTKTPSK